MTRLVVLNGPAASGKSTIARRYAEDHALTLVIDIDRVRAAIAGWREDRLTAGRLARAAALAAARVHLAAGHDVVVPQLLARPEFLDQLQALAGELGVEFHEIVLLCDLETSLSRWAHRQGTTTDPTQSDADDDLLDRGAEQEIRELHERLMRLLPTRPAARLVPVTGADVDAVYHRVMAAIHH